MKQTYSLQTCWRLLVLIMLAPFLRACQDGVPQGSILVQAPNNGSYEIYRIASENPIQFVSEQIGYFNQPLNLAIGQYLILADCSHKRIMVQQNQQQVLTAHLVRFIPPESPQESDSFSIQCDRFSKTRMRQHIFNRYRLNLLHGNREMLVAMVPMHIEFDSEGLLEPKTMSYELAALKLETFEGMSPKTSFFVSPADGLISVTKDQEFGHWQFLLPGKYIVEVNGTKKQVDVAAGERRIITPSFLQVSVDDKVDLQSSSNLLGTPLFVELNEDHWLDLNQTYPVLPGKARIKLNGSHSSHEIDLKAGEHTVREARSIVVAFDCPPWDWSCLGGHRIYLYNTDKAYPFAEGSSDVPVLFFEDDVWVSIQGSRDIRYKLLDSQRNFHLKVGSVRFIPNYVHRPNQITDLSRMEAIDLPFAGYTLDLPIEREMIMPLVAGPYHFAQYHSIYGNEYERRPNIRWMYVKPHETVDVNYSVFVSEQRYKQLQQAKTRREERRQEQQQSHISKNFQPIIPLEVQ